MTTSPMVTSEENMSEKITARCDCGKAYRLPPEKAGKKIRCKSCGGVILVPERQPAPAEPTPTPAPTPTPLPRTGPRRSPDTLVLAEKMGITDDIEVRDPTELMVEVNRSIVVKGLLIALIGHVLVFGLTSFGLYRDWAKYGIMLPSQIKEKKREEAEAVEQAKKEAERKARDEERRKEREEREKAEAEKKAQKQATATGNGAEGTGQSKQEKALEEKSYDRPADSPVDLDGDLGLE